MYLRRGENPKRRIIVYETEIIPLYDVPHLFKGIRNNLLTKNLIWESEDGLREAKWIDIEAAYQIDAGSGDVRAIPKITDFHVMPNKIKKMKVSYAMQVLSHTMAATIALMARNNETDVSGTYKMERRAQETSNILKFFDSLFDSLNGGTFRCPPGKILKSAVTRKSKHIAF